MWMFKAAVGQNRSVKEGSLGLEMILHLEEFSPWLQWLSTREQVFSLRWIILEMVSFCNCGLRSWLTWAQTEISQKSYQPTEQVTNMVIGDHYLGMNQSTKKLTKPQNTFIKMRGLWGHCTPWLPLEVPAPTHGLTLVLHDCFPWQRKELPFGWLELPPLSLHHFVFVWLGSETSPQGGPVVLINQS